MIEFLKHTNLLYLNAKQIIHVLSNEGFESRIIGGYVRDTLLGLEPKEIDIATQCKPENIVQILLKRNIRVIPTGIKFGTVTAILDNISYEITTLRQDISCDGRHAEVMFTDAFEIDAARRDFTINAISYCPIKNRIYDYFNGLEDIKNKCVKFIGDPDKRINEDYLRILRFFRFSAHYANTIDIEGLKAAKKYNQSIKNLSRERINAEIKKILSINFDISRFIKAMVECDIEPFFPLKINVTQYSKFYEIIKSLGIQEKIDINTRIASILDIVNTEYVTKNLVKSIFLSRKDTSILLRLINIKNAKDINDIKKAAYYYEDKNAIITLGLLFDVINISEAKYLQHLFLKDHKIDISAKDIIALNFQKKDIAKTINFLYDEWIMSDFKKSKENLLTLLCNSNEYNDT